MMWHRWHSYKEGLDLKPMIGSREATIQVWGAHAPRVPISVPRRNALLLNQKKVVGEAPTTAREGACAPRERCVCGPKDSMRCAHCVNPRFA
jgi:hypothetical protein